MAKLTFYYGTMGAGKSLHLLIERYNLIEQGRRVLVLKPACDTRNEGITSRINLNCDAVNWNETFLDADDYDFVLVDEAQFLSPSQVRMLHIIADEKPVSCYGLKTDFQTHLFEGSKRLLEIADEIIELKSKCKFCQENATFNMRVNFKGEKITVGDQVQVGGNESYWSVCKEHFK